MNGNSESVEDLKQQLQNEQERALKLKQLVIKEKKTNSSLVEQIALLTLQLTEASSENRKHDSGSLLDNERSESSNTGELHQALTECRAELDQCQGVLNDKEKLLSELNEQLKELSNKLNNSETNTRVSEDKLNKLQEEVNRLQPLRAELMLSTEKLDRAKKRESNLLNELEETRISVSLEREKTDTLRKVIENADATSAEQMGKLKASNDLLTSNLKKYQDDYKTCTKVLEEAEAKALSLSEQVEELNRAQETMKHTLTPQIDSVSASENSHTQNWRSGVSQYFDQFTDEFISTPDQSDTKIITMFANYLNQKFPSENDCAVGQTENLSSIDREFDSFLQQLKKMLNFSDSNDTGSSEFDKLLECVRALNVSERPLEPESATHTRIDSNNTETDRLHCLETRIHQMEVYAAEQVDRAKVRTADLIQKVERQSADYDKLLREKDAEIFELRESVDRLSDEVSTYASFSYSLMTFYCATCPTFSPDQNSTDWSAVANDIKNNEMGCRQLGDILNKFEQDLKLTLECCTDRLGVGPSENVADSRVHSDTNADVETLELQSKLDALQLELDAMTRRAMEAEKQVDESQGKSDKQEERMQRMKSMLLRLKHDANEHQKASTAIEQYKLRVQQSEMQVSTLEKDLLSNKEAKEHSDRMIGTMRDELLQLQITNTNMRDERDFAIDRLNKLQNDFNAYKVKALRTLRDTHGAQTNPTVDRLTESLGDEQTARMETLNQNPGQLEALRQQLTAVQERADEATLRSSLQRAECDLLREESDDLKHKHTKLLKEFKEQQLRWETQFTRLSQSRDQSAQDRSRELEVQLQTDSEKYELLLRAESEEHQKILREERALWSARLERSSCQLHSLQEQLDTIRREQRGVHQKQTPDRSSATPTPDMYNMSLSLYDRVRGDGADNTGPVHHSPLHDMGDEDVDDDALSDRTYASLELNKEVHTMQNRSGLLPLDQLLNNPPELYHQRSSLVVQSSGWSSPRSDDTRSRTDADSMLSPGLGAAGSTQVAGLRAALQNQQRRVEHLSELLHESEQNGVRLDEQAKMLKEEIRRIERTAHLNSQFCIQNQQLNNSDTTPSSPNAEKPRVPKDNLLRTEYLKNVILKVITLPTDSSERNQLVSVLATLLMLDRTEIDHLRKPTPHGAPSGPDTQGGHPSSWSSYLLGWGSRGHL